MPFWTTHALDRERGGLYSFLAPDGTVLDQNKSIVSNTRALYTFSALVRHIEDRPEWRRAADSIYRFLLDNGRDEQGFWVYLVDRYGRTLIGENSLVVEAFAIDGLAEYFRISGGDEATAIARRSCHNARARLARPGTYKTAPYPVPPGMRPHREAMQFSLAFCELGDAVGDRDILEAGRRLGRDVLDYFYDPERQVLHEYIGLDNRPNRETPAGRCMVPGHAIETLWFQMHNFGRIDPDDPERARRAAEMVRPALEIGWDPEYGGILLGLDIEGKQPAFWKFGTMKRWWPVTEALPACLMAWEILRESWCLDWYRRIHEWAFARFPDSVNGDWHQNLTREGKPIRDAADLKDLEPAAREWIELDLKVKDPFHLPRGLIMAINTLDRLT